MGVQQSERAVRALSTADPQFADLCKMLYGDALDPDEVWADVFGKRELTPLQQEKKRNRTQARVGLASNVLGLTAAAGATGSALRDDRLRGTKVGSKLYATGQKLPKMPAKFAQKHAGKLALGALGLQVANTTGDVVANRVLARSANAPIKRQVAKARPLGQLVRGALTGMRRLVPTQMAKPLSASTPKVNGPASVSAKSMDRARSMGTTLGNARSSLTATPGRTAATGLAAGAGVGGTAVASRPRGQADTSSVLSYYAKGQGNDVTWQGEFSKFDDDKRLAFGWASVVSKGGLPVVDRQGDLIDADEIEKAAYDYVLRSRVGGDMHKRNGDVAHKVSDLVESFVVTPEKIEKMGLPEDTPVGWWVGFKIHDDDAWQMVKKGERAGFSIHGKGRRVEKSMDEALNY